MPTTNKHNRHVVIKKLNIDRRWVYFTTSKEWSIEPQLAKTWRNRASAVKEAAKQHAVVALLYQEINISSVTATIHFGKVYSD